MPTRQIQYNVDYKETDQLDQFFLDLRGDGPHWLVGCVGLNGPLRQNFSLYRAVSQREGERKEEK